MLIANLNVLMLMETKMKNTKKEHQLYCRQLIFFSRIQSMSILIFQMSDIEIMNDKMIFICIASCGRNNMSKKGVAIIEKPKPVLVCKIEATNIIQMNMNIVFKKALLHNQISLIF